MFFYTSVQLYPNVLKTITDFGFSSSRLGEIFTNTSAISLPGYGYVDTQNKISVYGQNWSLFQSVYYSMMSLTTVGFGDYYLGRPDDPRQVTF